MPFQIIVADPAWPQNARNNTKTRFGGGARAHYSLMTLNEIKRLPVAEIAAQIPRFSRMPFALRSNGHVTKENPYLDMIVREPLNGSGARVPGLKAIL